MLRRSMATTTTPRGGHGKTATLYEVIQVEPSASQSSILSTTEALVAEGHQPPPWKGGPEGAEADAARHVVQAARLLRDPVVRARYDRALENGRRGTFVFADWDAGMITRDGVSVYVEPAPLRKAFQARHKLGTLAASVLGVGSLALAAEAMLSPQEDGGDLGHQRQFRDARDKRRFIGGLVGAASGALLSLISPSVPRSLTLAASTAIMVRCFVTPFVAAPDVEAWAGWESVARHKTSLAVTAGIILGALGGLRRASLSRAAILRAGGSFLPARGASAFAGAVLGLVMGKLLVPLFDDSLIAINLDLDPTATDPTDTHPNPPSDVENEV